MPAPESTAVDHLPTPNPTIPFAKLILAVLEKTGARRHTIDDLGQSARVVVKVGERRQPGDIQGADTERIFAIHISEIPRGQRP